MWLTLVIRQLGTEYTEAPPSPVQRLTRPVTRGNYPTTTCATHTSLTSSRIHTKDPLHPLNQEFIKSGLYVPNNRKYNNIVVEAKNTIKFYLPLVVYIPKMQPMYH